MANYPCPVCGASHKYPPEKCRLCGQLMGEDAVVGDFEGSRQTVQKRKGIFGIAALVALGVGLLVLAFVIFGVLPGREGITGVAANVPGLTHDSKTGWSTLSDEEGELRVDMPSENPEKETTVVTLPIGQTDTVVWSAWIGDDGLTEVTYAKGALPPGEREFDAISALGDQWEAEFSASTTASIDSLTETAVFGHPAIKLQARNVSLEEQPDKDFLQRTIAFFNNGTLYTVTEYTTNPDTDAYATMMASLGLTNLAPVADEG